MKRRTALKALAGTTLAVATAAGGPRVQAATPLTALAGGRLIDGYGGPPLEDSVVLIEGERIVAIGSLRDTPIPATATVVSTEGQSVLPGLWDACVSLSRLGHADGARWDELYLPLAERVVMPLAAAGTVRAGVTAARDVGSPLDASLVQRGRLRSLASESPRLAVSGPLIARRRRPGTATVLVDSPRAAREQALALVRAGVDALVVADAETFEDGELAAIVSVAHAAQSTVHVLATHDGALRPALAAGVDGLIGVGDGIGPWPAGFMEDVQARLLAGPPLVVASLLSPAATLAYLSVSHELLDDPRWTQGWPPLIAADVRSSLDDATLRELAAAVPAAWREERARRVAELVRAGALVVAGSGAGSPAQLPGFALASEIEALATDAGLGPLEALRRATYWASVAAGVQHESGTVTVDKYADLLCVRGDVLRHIDRLTDVSAVFRRGVRLV